MTFFEAAVEVLRRTGRPLHFKKITEIAVRDELLSHMGKSPDTTMATRLTQELKSQGESVIVETRPGVYSLRESEVDRLNEEAAKRLERDKERRRRRARADSKQLVESAEGEADEESEAGAEEGGDEPKRRRRSRRRSGRSSKSSRSKSSRSKSSRSKSSRSKSSRSKSSRSKSSRNKSSRSKSSRSRSSGNNLSGDDGHTDEELDAQVNGNLKSGEKRSGGKSRSGRGGRGDEKAGGRRRARGARRSNDSEPTSSPQEVSTEASSSVEEVSKPSRGSKSTTESKSSRRRSRSRSRSRRSTRDERSQKPNGRQKSRTPQSTPGATRHLEAGPVRLDGIAHAAYTVLQDAGSKLLEIQKLADEIFERKLVKFHTHDAAATVQAALANDNQIRRRRGHRPLFTQYASSRWGLSEWGLPAAAINKEQTILSLSEEIRQDTLGHLGEALVDVKDEALEHIALTLLERLGYQNIKVSKRSSSGDVYFTADWRQGLADVRVCIQVTLDGEDELGEDAVSVIRETLHHYSAAEGVIIHLGDISKSAIGESRQDEKAPITLIDRQTFVELLIRHGIGVQAYTTPILMVDTEFIETLKS